MGGAGDGRVWLWQFIGGGVWVVGLEAGVVFLAGMCRGLEEVLGVLGCLLRAAFGGRVVFVGVLFEGGGLGWWEAGPACRMAWGGGDLVSGGLGC
uniref:Uncharacterized protein n=1 Tax=Knipowitschia caucasica TaxID=637954 RepID=A0AAV2IWR5_KNICA